MTPSTTMSAAEDEPTASTTSAPRNGTYYPAPDELDPNVPINLNSLRDAPAGGDGKPLYSYATLIRQVGRANQTCWRLTGHKDMPSRAPLRTDCCWKKFTTRSSKGELLEARDRTVGSNADRYPYFKTAPAGWKVSKVLAAVFQVCFIEHAVTEFCTAQSVAQFMLSKGSSTIDRPWQGFILDGGRVCRPQARHSPREEPSEEEQTRR